MAKRRQTRVARVKVKVKPCRLYHTAQVALLLGGALLALDAGYGLYSGYIDGSPVSQWLQAATHPPACPTPVPAPYCPCVDQHPQSTPLEN